jgi:5'-methylthioadenosine phosphorylase
MTEEASLGVIGGSGFYEIEGLQDLRSLSIDTPYGPTSDAIMLGTLAGTRIAFVSRHGAGHRLLPGEVPYHANVWAMASLGVRQLVSVSAVGSLQEQYQPQHFLIPDQLIDRTIGARPATFFGDGIVAHVALDEPYCARLGAALAASTSLAGGTVHRGGALVVIDGPAFSTRAESFLYKAWGGSIIGMTAMPEARLAREAGICYACLACITDYDTWHAEHGAVTVEVVLRNLLHNVATARRSIASLAVSLPDPSACTCCESLRTALITRPEVIPASRRQDLAPILRHYSSLSP